MVVGSEAAQTPSRFILCSLFSISAKGGMQQKQEVSPGTMIWKWHDIAFSETPDSTQIWSSSLQAWSAMATLLIDILAA